MPDDVAAALERFQTFLGKHGAGGVIDEDSGFTVADGMLLVGEVQTNSHAAAEDNPID